MARQRFWRGESVRIDVTFTDDTGAPMNASGVAIQARCNNGPVIDGDVHPLSATGAFYAVFALEQAGDWAVRASCSGPTAAAVEDRFDVAPSRVI